MDHTKLKTGEFVIALIEGTAVECIINRIGATRTAVVVRERHTSRIRTIEMRDVREYTREQMEQNIQAESKAMEKKGNLIHRAVLEPQTIKEPLPADVQKVVETLMPQSMAAIMAAADQMSAQATKELKIVKPSKYKGKSTLKTDRVSVPVTPKANATNEQEAHIMGLDCPKHAKIFLLHETGLKIGLIVKLLGGSHSYTRNVINDYKEDSEKRFQARNIAAAKQ
jgi:hypothetical protein